MRAESMKCGRSGVLFDADAAPVLAHPFVVDVARDGREQGVVAAYADAASGRDLRAALADQDRSGVDELSAVDLHPEHLRVRVAAVARRTAALLVCQLLSLPLAPPARGLLGRLGCLFGFRFRGLRFRSRLFLRRRLGPAARRSTRMRSPGVTRYCFPPLTTTADGELSGLGTARDCTKGLERPVFEHQVRATRAYPTH